MCKDFFCFNLEVIILTEKLQKSHGSWGAAGTASLVGVRGVAGVCLLFALGWEEAAPQEVL